jgi:hypothetical protein
MEKVYVSPSLTASALVKTGLANYYGYTVIVATATGAINVRDGSVTGQIIDVIPATTAAGATKALPNGLALDDGLFVEFNGGATGTLVIHYE